MGDHFCTQNMKNTELLLNYICKVVWFKCFKRQVCEVDGNRLCVRAYSITRLKPFLNMQLDLFLSRRTEIISPAIDKQTGRRTTEEEDGLGRGVRGDQWANKTNRWDETTKKSEVINLQRQDDPTNRMH